MTTASRKQFRADLKTELAPAMTLLQSADDFYQYEPSGYNGHSPVIFLRPSGAEHGRNSKVLTSDFYVEVHFLTLYADKTNAIYNEEAATNLLDDIEKQFAEAVDAKRVVANKWQDLSFEGRSIAEPLPLGGEVYLHEVGVLHGKFY